MIKAFEAPVTSLSHFPQEISLDPSHFLSSLCIPGTVLDIYLCDPYNSVE